MIDFHHFWIIRAQWGLECTEGRVFHGPLEQVCKNNHSVLAPPKGQRSLSYFKSYIPSNLANVIVPNNCTNKVSLMFLFVLYGNLFDR